MLDFLRLLLIPAIASGAVLSSDIPDDLDIHEHSVAIESGTYLEPVFLFGNNG